jgi:hypothetical protein
VTTIPDNIWAAMIAAEDAHGEAAESFARGEAKRAEAAGNSQEAAEWNLVADELHILHLINRQWARPRSTPRPSG